MRNRKGLATANPFRNGNEQRSRPGKDLRRKHGALGAKSLNRRKESGSFLKKRTKKLLLMLSPLKRACRRGAHQSSS
jgi:hypothetical protein